MNHPGKIFLVEGLDLAGKSTACDKLLEQLIPRAELRRNAFDMSNSLYLAANELRKSDGLGGKYLGHAYLAAVALDMRLFRPPLNVRIQESTIGLRSLCHYHARGELRLANEFVRMLDNPAYPRFDAAVLLTASLEERLTRLNRRYQQNPEEVAPDDLAVIQKPDLFRRMEDKLIDEAVKRYGASVIDTSSLSKMEVVDAIAAAFSLPTK